MCNLGKILEVQMCELWQDEAGNFTPWVERNIQLLGAALDLDLPELARRYA